MIFKQSFKHGQNQIARMFLSIIVNKKKEERGTGQDLPADFLFPQGKRGARVIYGLHTYE